ncbi:MAG: 23S rRNA (pseudouridine(1915)-N(3))-methyltransferase RlmH [Candidatus Borkfalkiaceae bacterium]|nr:23S rRNA (pseudouridine(1915)-N(3))-methyltransferase RlmH [Clostridia bacterium]MDY6223051.1 23S rRNA (pseudouridine(1915)-N(3))-methyltransferase RlmH [Christensenellaceae bacterium]
MQKIRIVTVGKLKERFWKEAVAEYTKRLSRFADVEIKELPERNTLEEEGKDILSACRGYVTALAVEGEKFSSERFAALLKKKADEGAELTFVIGSSCGLCPAVKRVADRLLSFSDFTFPHQLMRVILCEQVYRAFMINSGSAYHK